MAASGRSPQLSARAKGYKAALLAMAASGRSPPASMPAAATLVMPSAVVTAANKTLVPKDINTVAELHEWLGQRLGVIDWRNPKTGVTKVVVHPKHPSAVAATGINPNHPLILWFDLEQPCGSGVWE
jgi:hypothetical protein